MAYKLGRLPRDLSRYAPTFEDYRAGGGLPVVAPADNVDRATDVTSWPMYDNDTLGDCTVAGIAHVISAMAVYGGNPLPVFSDNEIIRVYSAVGGYVPGDPNTDQGANMQTVLDYIKLNGMTDEAGKLHKIVAYAAFGNPKDTNLLAGVLNTFGAAYVGINCPASAQTQFGKLWSWQPCSPIEGGHAIGFHRRAPLAGQGPIVYSTWGALQPATLGFHKHYATEAWAVVSQDWLEANGLSLEGLNLAQLEADMHYV
jgi:hypothetical protein